MRFPVRRAAVQGIISLAVLMVQPSASNLVFARTEEAESYNQSADQLLKKGDLRGAVIQLRNAIQKDPEDGALRLKLAEIDLRLGEPLAAEASALAAKERGVPEEQIAPVLAQALYSEGEHSRLLKTVPPDDRAPKTESIVRTLRGLAHLALGERAEAETMLRDAVRLDPESVTAKVALVGWLMASGKLDEADQLVDAALASAPDNSQVLAAKGRVLAARGDTAGALAKLTAAVDRDPNNSSARLARVGLQVRKGDLDAAQQDVDLILKRAPKSGAALYFQALIQATRGDLKAADATLTKLGPSLGEPPETYYLAGVVKFRLGQPGQAEDYLRRYVARNPNSASAYTTLGTISLRKGNPRQAVDQLNQALKLAPGDVRALDLLGQAYAALGDPAKALEAIQSAAKAQPENPNLQAQVALTRMNQGETTEGIDALEHIFRADDKGATIGPALIITALRVGEFEKAANAADDLIKRDPDNILYQQLLGIARAANRDLAGAETAFRRLVEKNPDLLPARRNLAEVYLALGRNDDAQQLFDAPLKKNPNDAVALSMLAEVDVRSGKIPEAIDLLARAQSTATDSGSGLRLVALYQSQKDMKSALSTASDLKKRFPQDPNAVDALARAQIASGDVVGGLSTYRQGTETITDSLPLLDRYARALLANKDFAVARDVLRHELSLAPGNQTVEAQIVQAEYSASGPDAALAAARSFSSPDTPVGEILAAEVWVENGKTDQGIKLLEKTLSEKPSSAVVNALASFYARADQKDRQVDLLKTWMAGHHDDIAVRLTLAQAYLNAHDEPHARAEYEALSVARESDPRVLNNLAWLYQRAGDPRAQEVAQRAYRLAPTPAIGDTLGWILTMQGGADVGLKYLENAGKAMPDNFDVQYHLAVALQKTGKVDDARGILRKIVAQQGEFDSKADAKTLLSQLGG